jgi:hypothetical protein
VIGLSAASGVSEHCRGVLTKIRLGALGCREILRIIKDRPLVGDVEGDLLPSKHHVHDRFLRHMPQGQLIEGVRVVVREVSHNEVCIDHLLNHLLGDEPRLLDLVSPVNGQLERRRLEYFFDYVLQKGVRPFSGGCPFIPAPPRSRFSSRDPLRLRLGVQHCVEERRAPVAPELLSRRNVLGSDVSLKVH